MGWKKYNGRNFCRNKRRDIIMKKIFELLCVGGIATVITVRILKSIFKKQINIHTN